MTYSSPAPGLAGGSAQTQLPAHLQLSLKSNMSTKGTRKTYAI
jgi:hypothetical protein